MDVRARIGLVALVGGALFLLPLAHFDELGVWRFDERVSNLEWDEAGIQPKQSGGDAGAGGGSGGDTGGSGGDGGGSGSSSSDTGGSGGGGSGGSGSAGTAGDSEGGSDAAGFGFFSGLGLFSVSFGVIMIGWSGQCMAWMAAFAQVWAGFALALLALAYALAFMVFGVYGGILAGGVTGLLVYLHSTGALGGAPPT